MNKFKLAALLFAAFTAGEISNYWANTKRIDDANTNNKVKADKAWREGHKTGWQDALREPWAVKTAYITLFKDPSA